MTEEVKDRPSAPPENPSDTGEKNPPIPAETQTAENDLSQPEIVPSAPAEPVVVPEIQDSDIKEYPINPLKPDKTKPPKKKSRFPAILATILLMMPVTAVFFVAGLLIGGEYGISSKKVDVTQIPFIDTLKNAIDQVSAVPLTLTITEQQINDAILQAKDEFSPMKNMNVSIQNDVCTFSGQIATADIKPLIGENVPEMLYLFLPDTLNLKADFGIDQENPTEPKVKTLSILNMEKSDEFIKGLGFDSYIESVIREKLTQSVPAYMEVSSFRIENGKIQCNATVNILK